MERRTFLRSTMALSLLTVTGCGARPVPEQTITQENSPNRLLVDIINELPPSDVKNGLVRDVVPWFQNGSPQSIQLDDLEIPLYDPRVTLHSTTEPRVSGDITPRSEILRFSPEAALATETTVTLPYLGLFIPNEQVNFEMTTDGTPVLQATFPPGTEIADGLRPEIEVTAPSYDMLPDELESEYTQLTKAVLVKEAATLWLYSLWTKSVIRKMNELQLPTTVPVIERNGDRTSVEVVTSLVEDVLGQDGRLLATIDIGGSALMIQALKETDTLSVLERTNPAFAAAEQTLVNYDQTRTDQETWQQTFQWVLTDPSATALPHKGNLNTFP